MCMNVYAEGGGVGQTEKGQNKSAAAKHLVAGKQGFKQR